MRKLVFAVFLFWAAGVFAAEVKVEGRPQKVVFYRQGAFVKFTAEASLEEGRNVVYFTNIKDFVPQDYLRVKTQEGLSVYSVKIKNIYQKIYLH